MRRFQRPVVGTALFFFLAPGTVAGVVPWAIHQWHGSPDGLDVVDALGGALVLVGLAAVVACFVRFAREGRGTPAPVAPTETLVVGGLYRFVRNPMYVGVGAVVAGQAIAFRSLGTTFWLGAFMVAVGLFVAAYEEPTLSRQYGPSYAAYRRAVRAWWPRLTPYRGR